MKDNARFTIICKDLNVRQYSAMALSALEVGVETETIFGRLTSPGVVEYENQKEEVKQEVKKITKPLVDQNTEGNIPAEFDLDLVVNTVIQELYPYMGKTIQKNIDKGIKKGELDALPKEEESEEPKQTEVKEEPVQTATKEVKQEVKQEETKVEEAKQEEADNSQDLKAAFDDAMGSEKPKAEVLPDIKANDPAPVRPSAPVVVEEVQEVQETQAATLEGPTGPVQREAIAEYFKMALERHPEDPVLKGFEEWFSKVEDNMFVKGQNLLNLAQIYVNRDLSTNSHAQQEAYSMLTNVFSGFNIKEEAVKSFDEKYAPVQA